MDKPSKRKIVLSKVPGANTIAGLLLGGLCWLLSSVINSTWLYVGFYKTAPYYFSAAGRYTLDPTGPGVVLLILSNLWLLYIIFRYKLFAGLWIAMIIAFLGLVSLPSCGHVITEGSRSADTKYNLKCIKEELDTQFSKSGYYPLDIYSIITEEKGEEYDGEGFHRMPMNRWSVYRLDNARLAHMNDRYANNLEEVFTGDSRSLIGTDTSRFGTEGLSMGNVSTGYDVGRELVSWWDAFSEGEKPKKEQALLRGILAGNFIYLPCDATGNPIPFSKVKTTLIESYRLIAFGSPTNLGMDVWTPTGDPDMPIKLERDGKPDGVILVLQDEDG